MLMEIEFHLRWAKQIETETFDVENLEISSG